MIRNVWPVPIHPHSDILEDPRLRVHVRLGILLTLLDETIRPQNILYVLLRRELEGLLHHQLYGQTMAIESWLVPDVVALHPPVADRHILEDLVVRSAHM